MATQPTSGLTYADLEAFPEDNVRRELIAGELIVTASPVTRHQTVVIRLGARLLAYAEANGGAVFPAPYDVYLSDLDVVEPDVVLVRADNMARVEERFVRGAPDVVVEVSSPSTRVLDVTRKLKLYERAGVPEYWFVDLDAQRIEVYRLDDDGYGAPRLLGVNDELNSTRLPGLSIEIDYLLQE